MEMIKRLNVPAAFLYDKIVGAVLVDIKHQTGKTLSKKELTDFEYIRQYSDHRQAKIKIERNIENQAYHFRTSTVRNDFLVRYDIQPLDANRCQLTYQEEIKSFSLLHKINGAVIGTVRGMLKKKQFQKILTAIETSY